MDRPRRSARAPNKAPQLTAPKSSIRSVKRRPTPEPIAPEVQLKTLLESSKSDLVSKEMSEIINMDTWLLLSSEEQANLKTLLPPTAFLGARESIGKDHPSVEDEMNVDDEVSSELNPAFFNDPHFLAACRTFQDHLYLNWFSAAHIRKVAKYQQDITDGTVAAPWKDEVWERDNPTPVVPNVPSTSSFALAGASSEVKLPTLVKNNILRVGDVLAYRRGFAGAGITVEKDCIIDFVNPKNHSLNIRTLPGMAHNLPAELLMTSQDAGGQSTMNEGLIQTMTISSPSMLENALLDLDGRVEKSRRPNGNAWKSFTVWRWRAGAGYQPYDSRGGRENHGTLFYLRGSYYHEE